MTTGRLEKPRAVVAGAVLTCATCRASWASLYERNGQRYLKFAGAGMALQLNVAQLCGGPIVVCTCGTRFRLSADVMAGVIGE